MLVEERDLPAGNSIILGTNQLVGFIGPTIAGLLIAGFSNSPVGVGLAYAIDATSFAVSAFVLLLIQGGGIHPPGDVSAGKESIWASVLAGMKYLWDDRALRLMFLVVTILNFLIIGPILVGIPVLADQHLAEGAAAFGLLVSGIAGGNLAGYLLAANLPRPGGKVIRFLLLAALAAFGVAIGSLGFIRWTSLLFVIMVLLGLGNGYISIIVLTWIQSRTPREMLGRMMSMLMLTNTGLSPVSQAVSGLVSKLSITVLFVSAGAGLLLVPLWAARQPALKTITESLAANPMAEEK
jgi:hypothetical protein